MKQATNTRKYNIIADVYMHKQNTSSVVTQIKVRSEIRHERGETDRTDNVM